MDLLSKITPIVRHGTLVVFFPDTKMRSCDSAIHGLIPHVLVIDDTPAVAVLFERILAEDGYTVTCVQNFRMGRLSLGRRPADVIIIDLSLPDADGIQAIAELRQEYPFCKILAVSGFMVGSVPKRVKAAGADATLPKPTDPGKIRQTVYRLIDPGMSWHSP